MGSDLNEANITLNSSTDFRLATSEFGKLQPIYDILRFCDLKHRVVEAAIYCWSHISKLLYMQISTGVE